MGFFQKHQQAEHTNGSAPETKLNFSSSQRNGFQLEILAAGAQIHVGQELASNSSQHQAAENTEKRRFCPKTPPGSSRLSERPSRELFRRSVIPTAVSSVSSSPEPL